MRRGRGTVCACEPPAAFRSTRQASTGRTPEMAQVATTQRDLTASASNSPCQALKTKKTNAVNTINKLDPRPI